MTKFAVECGFRQLRQEQWYQHGVRQKLLINFRLPFFCQLACECCDPDYAWLLSNVTKCLDFHENVIFDESYLREYLELEKNKKI